jgi:hypothetical protein
MTEKSRTIIALENDDSREEFHDEDTSQIRNLQLALDQHCDRQIVREGIEDSQKKEMVKTLKKISDNIDSLMWMNEPDTKGIILETVKEAKGRTWLSVKIAKFLKTAGIVVAILSGVSAIIWAIISEGRR